MNWDQFQGEWMQLRGAVKEKWGKLTDDDLEIIDGHRDKLIGRLQKRYGMAREQAERAIEEWLEPLRNMG